MIGAVKNHSKLKSAVLRRLKHVTAVTWLVRMDLVLSTISAAYLVYLTKIRELTGGNECNFFAS